MVGSMSLSRGIGLSTAALVVVCAFFVTIPQVSSVRYIVGSGLGGWTSNVNYTIWARDKHFYLGDWLFFVYDRNQQSVLEVNKTNYETCNTEHPLHNWTTGAGRDVVPLNVTKTYYFVSGNGFCYGGMKVAIHVEKPPPPPSALPHKNGSPSVLSTVRGQVLVPALLAIGAVWDSFLLAW